jgi:hypothetical protein
VAAELAEQKVQNEHIEIEVQKLHDRVNQILLETVDLHATNMGMFDERKTLTDLTTRQQEGILDAERVISRLQAEYQILSVIFTDAQHDRLQMEKEHQVVENNHQVLRDNVANRQKTIDEMRSTIGIEQSFLRKCASQFQEKTIEIHVMMGELSTLEAKTRELEAKRETMLTLEYNMHRLVSENMFEKQKCMALIHEFSVLRNVHRWHALAAVDPTYAKQLVYRGSLSAKIDAAHRKLIELRAERDALKRQLKKEGPVSKDHSALPARDQILAYQQDLHEKEGQLRELKRMVAENDPSLRNSVTAVHRVHEKVVERRETAAKLRTQSTSVFNPRPQGWFITEAPVHTFLGGGFVSRPTVALPEVPGTYGVSTSPLLDRRSKSSFASPTAKRQQRFIPNSHLFAARKPLPALP